MGRSRKKSAGKLAFFIEKSIDKKRSNMIFHRKRFQMVNKFFDILKVIACAIVYIISKIYAFAVSLGIIVYFHVEASSADFAVRMLLTRIAGIVITCIPTMAAAKINGYSSWWVTADLVVTSIVFFCMG